MSDLYIYEQFYPKNQEEQIISKNVNLFESSFVKLLLQENNVKELLSAYYFNLALDLSNYSKEKIFYYKKAIEIKEDKHEAWYNLGNTYSKIQNYQEAINSYKKAIQIKEDYHLAWNNLGITYHNLQNYQEAINSYKKAIELKEDFHEAWEGLGITYSHLKNYQEAEKCYNKALEISPNNENVFYNLACLYSLQNEKQKSLFHLEKAIELNPNKYKPMAKQDEDFKNLWEDKDFLALVSE